MKTEFNERKVGRQGLLQLANENEPKHCVNPVGYHTTISERIPWQPCKD
jgi:hypothetical protein